MATIPGQHLCDFCSNEIHEGQVYSHLAVPLPQSLRRELVADAEKHLMPRMATSPLSGMISADNLVPQTWNLSICSSCSFGLVPGGVSKLRDLVQATLSRGFAARARTVKSLAELEETP